MSSGSYSQQNGTNDEVGWELASSRKSRSQTWSNYFPSAKGGAFSNACQQDHSGNGAWMGPYPSSTFISTPRENIELQRNYSRRNSEHVDVGGMIFIFAHLQCSRFHLLQEFDEGKRSFRRRLAGHKSQQMEEEDSS
eukprot:Gb_33146 [translate_table: standard]